MDKTHNVLSVNYSGKIVWFVYLCIISIASIVNASCSVSTFGWIFGWYLLIGHLVVAYLALRCNSSIIHGGIFLSLILQVIDFARHDFHVELFFRCFSCGEGYEIARFLVITLLVVSVILATVSCSRGLGFKALTMPYLIESVLSVMFINAFLYQNALIANVLGIFMIACISTKPMKKYVIAKFMIVCLYLTFPYVGNIDSSILQIENMPIVEISDYAIKLHSKHFISLVNLIQLALCIRLRV